MFKTETTSGFLTTTRVFRDTAESIHTVSWGLSCSTSSEKCVPARLRLLFTLIGVLSSTRSCLFSWERAWGLGMDGERKSPRGRHRISGWWWDRVEG